MPSARWPRLRELYRPGVAVRLNLDRWETHLDIREPPRHSLLRQVWFPTKAAPNEEWLGILLLGESEKKEGQGGPGGGEA